MVFFTNYFIRFANDVKLKIGIFGGSFEVSMDNLALFRAHVLMWRFDVINGKAAFKMAAGFKNDIPKDLIHTISDTADGILAKVDALTSIFAKHIQNFIDKLKNYRPLDAKKFLVFISNAAEFIKRTIQSTRFGKLFLQIANNLRNASRNNSLWQRISDLLTKLLANISKFSFANEPFKKAFQLLAKLADLVTGISSKLPSRFPVNFNIKDFVKHVPGRFKTIEVAVADYFQNQGLNIPGNFLELLRFKISLRFPVSLDTFKTITVRLINFGNSFLEMLSVFREMIKIELPHIHLPEHRLVSGNGLFDFGLSFDWRIKFTFNIDMTGADITKLRNCFSNLLEIFRQLDGPNVDLENFFHKFLPTVRNNGSTDLDLPQNASNLNIAQWFREVIKAFVNILDQQDAKLLDFSHTSAFLEELRKEAVIFSKKTLKKVCTVQGFMLYSARKLQEFGENLENETIVTIRKIEDEAQEAIAEVVNVTLLVQDIIDDLKENVANRAQQFVNEFLTKLETSLENAKELADNVAEFSSNTTDKLHGFCHKTADVSGEILDKIQSEAESAVKELSEFITTNPPGIITRFLTVFKSVVTDVEYWSKINLQKRFGKFALVAETLEEFLSLLKNENIIGESVRKIFSNIKNVLSYLNNLPQHAEEARQAADKFTDFATNAKRWEGELKKIKKGRKFKLDFDNQLQKLCGKFQQFAKDTIKKIQGNDIIERFRGFLTDETAALISRGVGKLDLLKEPLQLVLVELRKVSESVNEVESVVTEMKPFSENFPLILQKFNQLPSCSDIEFIFDNVMRKCGKSAKAFGKQAYGEYVDLRSEVKAFQELLPEHWESLRLQKCITGGTCLSEALKKQAQGISRKIMSLKKKFNTKELYESLDLQQDVVEEVSRVVEQVKNISILVEEFSLKDEVIKMKYLARKITGKLSKDHPIKVCSF